MALRMGNRRLLLEIGDCYLKTATDRLNLRIEANASQRSAQSQQGLAQFGEISISLSDKF